MLLAAALIAACITLWHGCSSMPRYPEELTAIDSLCDVAPDSAAKALKKCSARYTGNDEASWYFRYVRLKSKVKADSVFTDDSETKAIVAHFEDNDERNLSAAVFYCAGCVYTSMNDYPQATDYFLKAYEECSADWSSKPLQALCSYQLGYIYSMQGLDHEAIPWQKKALAIHRSIGNERRCVYDYENMAWSYTQIGRTDTVLPILRSAETIAKRIGNREINEELYVSFASFYKKRGDMLQAKRYIDYAFGANSGTVSSSTNALALEIYSNVGEDEKASRCCDAVINSGNVYGKRYAYYWLARKSLNNGNDAEARAFLQKYKEFSDSVDKITPAQASALANSIYNYSLREKENARLAQENVMKSFYLAAAAATVIIIILLFTIVSLAYSRRKAQLRERVSVLKAALEKERLLNEEGKAQKEAELEEMRTRLASFAEERNDDGKIKLENEIHNASKRLQAIHDAIKDQDLTYRRLLATPIYKLLKASAASGELPTVYNWQALEECIYDIYPKFKAGLTKLEKMSDIELRVSMLVKSGFKVTEIARLTCRKDDSIYSICKRLYTKNFRSNGSYKEWKEVVMNM